MLYAAESQSQQHIYMMLIVMLILTQDEQFNRAVHEVVSSALIHMTGLSTEEPY